MFLMTNNERAHGEDSETVPLDTKEAFVLQMSFIQLQQNISDASELFLNIIVQKFVNKLHG